MILQHYLHLMLESRSVMELRLLREIADVTIEGDHLHGLVTLKHISNHLMRRNS